ncbi:hypothetical protein NC652_032274 [Populus alba x Populus x berolinensis]|nr:hypothetical protein NC652_032274 [Populus alba x Populus x berolinensis]
MRHPFRSFSYSLIKSSATIITFILVLSCFMNVESSRTSGRHLLSPSSIYAFKKAPAYGASHSHGGLEHLSQEFSGPSHGGIEGRADSKNPSSIQIARCNSPA